jgi:hypothetical protein
MMTERQRSPQAAQAFQVIMQRAANLPVTRPADVSDQAQIISLLAQAHANRETRTFELTQGMPLIMWAMLIGISLVLMGFVVFAGLENPAHTIFACAFAASTVLVLVLVRMLDYPFEGALTLNNADFAKLIGEVAKLVAG